MYETTVMQAKDRIAFLCIEKGKIEVEGGSFVVRTQDREDYIPLPIGKTLCIMMEPGTRISHAAVSLAAKVHCLLIWTGEGGVRIYSSGQPGGSQSGILKQALKSQEKCF